VAIKSVNIEESWLFQWNEVDKKKVKCREWKEECNMKLCFFGLVIATLLVVGRVEMNQGPFSVKEEAEILEFIRKTEGWYEHSSHISTLRMRTEMVLEMFFFRLLTT
jgi:hypothetical protein